MYEAKVIADSISPAGARITTMQLRFPRFLLAQFNTHRAFSRNARSSRAVPIRKILKEIESDPVLPVFWGSDWPGMQSKVPLDDNHIRVATEEWLTGKDRAVEAACELMDTGVHKQIVNRLLEPFMWADVVVTSTSWDNFFNLRCHEEAQPEMQRLAVMMARALRDSVPKIVYTGSWHLPYVLSDDLRAWSHTDARLMISVARCARVSFKPHNGKSSSFDRDEKLHRKLRYSGHWSPFEHQALCIEDAFQRSSNFAGWKQYRKILDQDAHTKFDFASLDKFGERGFIVPN